MGTSASSGGPSGGVPFDPPWLDGIGSPQPDEGGQPEGQGDDDVDGIAHDGSEPEQHPQPLSGTPGIAPPKRFQSARRALRDFVRTGNRSSFRKAVGHYSRTGMGGARNVATRMRASARIAGSLFDILQAASKAADPAVREWIAALTGRNAAAQDIFDEIIRKVAPNGGSQDEVSCRESMAQAMEDLLDGNPDIDLLHLTDDHIWRLVESFLAYEAFTRLCLDIGQVFEDSTLSPRERVMRMNEMQAYLKAELSVQIEHIRQGTQNAALNQLQVVLRTALENTFLVYEGSL